MADLGVLTVKITCIPIDTATLLVCADGKPLGILTPDIEEDTWPVR